MCSDTACLFPIALNSASMTVLTSLLIALLLHTPGWSNDKTISAEIVVPAAIEDVWDAWTTEAGLTSFFAPAAHIELRIDGAYELYFAPDAEPGNRGSDDMRILAMDPPRMLAFTWNAPPNLPTVRNQHTYVQVKLKALSETETQVRLIHTGFSEGGEWEGYHRYFAQTWSQYVLPYLRHRFAVGPIDWDNPPPSNTN